MNLSLLTYPQMKLDARAVELDGKHSAASSLAAALEQERSSATKLAKTNADKVSLLVYNIFCQLVDCIECLSSARAQWRPCLGLLCY
jgi:hypothetical protein